MAPTPQRSRTPVSREDILRRYLDDTGAARRAGSPVPDARARPRGASTPSGRPRPEVMRGEDAPPLLGGKFRLGRLIARGGIGEVFEATQEALGRRVAVKMIRSEYSGSAELSARFLQEARAAAAVGHPGCVQIYDVGVAHDGRTYIVMERLDGEDLLARMRSAGPLSVEEAAAVCADALEVLAATHEKGIVHRDLKPENIFLVANRSGAHGVKLLDFGIARLVDADQEASRLTRPGTAVGTPFYMSPEQARGAADVDASSDIYAVGVVLFEAVTGRLPFEGATYNEVMVKVLENPFPSARALRPELPEALEAVIRRATAKRRNERYASATEFALDLLSFAGREALWSMHDGPSATPPRAVTPRPDAPGTPPRPPVAGRTPRAPYSHSTPREHPSSPPSWLEPVSTITPMPFPRRPSVPAPVVIRDRMSRARQYGLFLGGFALALVLAVGAFLLGRSTGDSSPGDTVRVSASGAPVLEAVRIRVLGVPEGGEVLLDGRPVPPEFVLPRSDDERSIELRVAGRPPQIRLVRPDSDRDVDFSPEPAPTP